MPKQKKRSNRRKLIGLTTLVVVIALGLVLLHVRSDKPNTRELVQQTNITKTEPLSTAKAAPATNTVVPNPTPITDLNVPGGTVGSNVGSQPTLTTPTGNFVSNHGDDTAYPVTAGTAESSTCTTTPGATCNIQFTNSQTGSVESLGSQTTSTEGSKDSSAGTVSWTWTPSQEGLTTGAWTITVITTLDGQTKTSTDPLVLNVSS